MNKLSPDYRRNALRPWECYQEGWSLLKGEYWLFFAISFVGMLLANLAPFGILLGPMMCGIYLSFFKRMKGEKVTMETLFKGFDYFGESLVATLLQFGLLILAIIPLMVIAFMVFIGGAMAEGGDMSHLIVPTALLIMAFILLTVAFYGFFLFTYQLIVDRRLSAVQAIKWSVKAASANLWGVLGLVLLGMLFSLVGFLGFYIGIFFVMPLILAAAAVAYRQVFPELKFDFVPEEKTSVNIPD